jgi:hypothetical protein
MSTHVVVRSFPGPGGALAAGTEVDASRWRNVDALGRRRYLRPIARPASHTDPAPQAPDAAPGRSKR